MKSKSEADPEFVSDQVSQARRYYLNLKPPESAPLTVVCGGVERMRTDYVINRDRFPYFGIELVTEGRGELMLDGESFTLSPGNVFAYGPKTAHRIANQAPSRMRKFYVDFVGQEAFQLASDAGLMDSCPLRVTRMHELVEVFEMLDREARADSDTAGEVCNQLLRLLLIKIRQCCLADSPMMPRAYATYERVRQHIESEYLRLHTIEEVASECDVTPIHLSRLFRRFGGVGAYRYLLRIKMNHAAEMLLEERLLIKEVAERMGFSDAFQFSRAFKRVYGIPPKQLIQSSSDVAKPDSPKDEATTDLDDEKNEST
ncbi:AraC family transcriptional regulator [Rubripirellula reticaptiva]|uniref:HTH-type transcriptional activator Btr n=1 Tax=Rubripirellula reticaptiva TaxID=2528013 RepID=A0A5C6EFR6_9BACT|nr:AraC family transcriptional regulator [Rubripirellula reticaptiva]TWU46897.1 HTH-type transcriptional activator Btr [Rubripirellula reticaptiva]